MVQIPAVQVARTLTNQGRNNSLPDGQKSQIKPVMTIKMKSTPGGVRQSSSTGWSRHVRKKTQNISRATRAFSLPPQLSMAFELIPAQPWVLFTLAFLLPFGFHLFGFSFRLPFILFLPIPLLLFFYRHTRNVSWVFFFSIFCFFIFFILLGYPIDFKGKKNSSL